LLGLDPYIEYAEAGSDIPDLDLWFGKHRKTLHNISLLFLSRLIKDDEAKLAYALGLASHLFMDKMKGTKEALELVRRLTK